MGCSNTNKNVRADFIEKKVGEVLSELSFTDEELVEIDARTKTDIALLENKRPTELEENDRKKKKIREDLKYLHTNKLSLLKGGAYSIEAFLEEENRLNGELDAFKNDEHASDTAMREVIKNVVLLSELLRNTYGYYQKANPSEKELIIRTIFSELSLHEENLTYKCRKGFEALEKRFISNCDPIGIRTRVFTVKG